jgi:hypothetical protein
MGARDSESDLGRVFPDLTTMQRDADPNRRRVKLEQALDNPEVDAALLILRRGLKEGEDPLYYAVPHRDATPVPPVQSPWADGADEAVSKEALPSALAPGAAPPVTIAPLVQGARRPRAGSLRAAVIAVLAVFVPLVLMWLLYVRPRPLVTGGDLSPAALPSAASTAPKATAAALPTAERAMPASSAAVEAPALSVRADAGAAPPPSALPRRKPLGPKRLPTKPSAAPEDDAPEMIQ